MEACWRCRAWESGAERAGFSDVEEKENPLSTLACQTLSKLRDSIRRLSVMLGGAIKASSGKREGTMTGQAIQSAILMECSDQQKNTAMCR